jgi:tetratricopeptide (TPR) repeat protein
MFGADYASIRETVSKGNLYRDQGNLEEAAQIYQRAIASYTKALGPEHASTIDTINTLGNLYSDQGKVRRGGADVPAGVSWV